MRLGLDGGLRHDPPPVVEQQRARGRVGGTPGRIEAGPIHVEDGRIHHLIGKATPDARLE